VLAKVLAPTDPQFVADALDGFSVDVTMSRKPSGPWLGSPTSVVAADCPDRRQ
jgi:hypothetical protein